MLQNQTDKRVTMFDNRTNTLLVAVGYDVSGDTLTSEVREAKSYESDIIAEWDVQFVTDGADGELVLTCTLAEVGKTVGWMDLKRVSGGEATQVWDSPIEVLIKDPVTE